MKYISSQCINEERFPTLLGPFEHSVGFCHGTKHKMKPFNPPIKLP